MALPAGRIAVAVNAFGSVAAAAGLDIPERTIRAYLAQNPDRNQTADQ